MGKANNYTTEIKKTLNSNFGKTRTEYQQLSGRTAIELGKLAHNVIAYNEEEYLNPGEHVKLSESPAAEYEKCGLYYQGGSATLSEYIRCMGGVNRACDDHSCTHHRYVDSEVLAG